MLKLESPNTVLANALNKTVDLLRPRLALKRPTRVDFVVGTQINGTPHLGTNITQCAAFVLAREIRNIFSVDTAVVFNALDNAPKEIELDPESFHSYQTTYRHALGYEAVSSLTEKLFRDFFEGISDRTAVDYKLQLYSDQQAQPAFRSKFLQTLSHRDELRWCVAPSSGIMHVRFPCPVCQKAEKRGERTRLLSFDSSSASYEAVCYDHGPYEVLITPASDAYLDLSTIYRNVVKEAQLADDPDVLSVMIKGGDWAFACQLVDWGLGVLGYRSIDLPVRWFTPQIVVDSGAKLSKSLIARSGIPVPRDLQWVLDTQKADIDFEDYLDSMLELVVGLVNDPKHFFRAISYQEINRLMHEQTPESRIGQRARQMRIYRKYFDLIASGEKTVEIRVGYSSMLRIMPDQLLLFTASDTDKVLTRVKAVRKYKSFDDLFETEDVKAINPYRSKADQLAEVRKIFSPDKEALGVLAIEIEKVD